MCNIRNSGEDHRRREGKLKGKKEREISHKRFLMIENKLRVDGGWWVGDGLDG